MQRRRIGLISGTTQSARGGGARSRRTAMLERPDRLLFAPRASARPERGDVCDGLGGLSRESAAHFKRRDDPCDRSARLGLRCRAANSRARSRTRLVRPRLDRTDGAAVTAALGRRARSFVSVFFALVCEPVFMSVVSVRDSDPGAFPCAKEGVEREAVRRRDDKVDVEEKGVRCFYTVPREVAQLRA